MQARQHTVPEPNSLPMCPRSLTLEEPLHATKTPVCDLPARHSHTQTNYTVGKRGEAVDP